MSDSEGGSGVGVWSWDDVEGLDPALRPQPKAVDPEKWTIWSLAREAWLRKDAMVWTTDAKQAGRWTESGAKERADNLPVEDSAIALNSTEGGRS